VGDEIKTFPLHFALEKLRRINKAAAESRISTKAFILKAIDEKMKREE